jgi:hypothetical protein
MSEDLRKWGAEGVEGEEDENGRKDNGARETGEASEVSGGA